jgi:hypothetical protein
MNSSLEKYVERMQEVTNNKYRLLNEILVMTREQSKTISEEGIGALEKLVSDKQIKIDAVNELDEQFDVYFQRMKIELKVKNLDEIRSPSIKGINELKESIADVMGLLRQISEIEKRNSDGAKKLLSGISSEIKKLNVGKKVSNAYKPVQNQASSYFIDKKK